tara:strand:- start:108 stop:518 length:411 start_codon:yes stop_codon:yes gene_type:complete
MINGIEHIGIAVSDLEKATKKFEKIFEQKPYKEELVNTQNVRTVFFNIGDSNTKIELIGSTNPVSPIAKYLKNNKEGIHHIALNVVDIHKEMNRLKSLGIRLLNELPNKGADNKLICFLHPKDTNGVLIEICQEII